MEASVCEDTEGHSQASCSPNIPVATQTELLSYAVVLLSLLATLLLVLASAASGEHSLRAGA